MNTGIEITHCQHPDRDVPRLKCGYPLPCPYHTLTVRLGNPSTIEEPSTVTISPTNRRRLKAIADILASPQIKQKKKKRKSKMRSEH